MMKEEMKMDENDVKICAIAGECKTLDSVNPRAQLFANMMCVAGKLAYTALVQDNIIPSTITIYGITCHYHPSKAMATKLLLNFKDKQARLFEQNSYMPLRKLVMDVVRCVPH